VLSLFFIDRVANYRYYDENGNPQKGIYAKLFEKHYTDLIKQPQYICGGTFISISSLSILHV